MLAQRLQIVGNLIAQLVSTDAGDELQSSETLDVTEPLHRNLGSMDDAIGMHHLGLGYNLGCLTLNDVDALDASCVKQ